ncbi:hypothetical protein [Kitasatospora sp. NPDC090308]|uniref:hypothetical protein n=1 Tax=Kitasatospora sp. NPDC090308 TaxID=3364082 RepID=UPI0038309885
MSMVTHSTSARAGLHTLTDDDHLAVRDLTCHLDAATVRQVANWSERTRVTAHALAAPPERPARPVVRRSGF